MQILIRNLNEKTTARHLADLFLPYGMVRTVRIISDRITGHSLGYGYIEMEPNCGKLAVERLDRRLFMNFYMEVKEV